MRNLKHKNIIQEKYLEKQKVIVMYKDVLERMKNKLEIGRIEILEIEEKIKTAQEYLYLIEAKYPEYLI